jgi:hypothetical protein
MNAGVWIGLATMVVSQAATLRGIEPFLSWNTPIAWTGFIVCVDSIVFQVRGDSWLRSNPGEFALLAAASVPLWLVFEGFNLVIQNWYYVGLPEDWWLRQFGYAWSFATIWPAIFEAAELFAVWKLGFGSRQTGGSKGRPGKRLSKPALASLTIAGALLLVSPFVVSQGAARYMAAPVWLGFIFLLDPINLRLGAESLLGDAAAGRYGRLVNLSLSGFLCGVLWELWNYWAAAKWHYTVPIMEDVRVFEMPLPGYLGFPAFALECFTMYVFVRAVFTSVAPAHDGPGRRIAL